MDRRIVLLALLASLGPLASCAGMECGDGTTERDGVCVAPSLVVGNAMCGPFTELEGGKCIPMFPPTVCDPETTELQTDSTGVTTCVSNGATGCAVRLACPTPAAGSETVCGQIYDFESNTAFAASGATGARCTQTTADGPCSLAIHVFDAIAFATNPTSASELPNAGVYLDDCGRYRVTSIQIGQAPSGVVALGFDDADASKRGPVGTSNATGRAFAASATVGALPDLDGFVVPIATSTKWAQSGGPVVDGTRGVYAPIFHGHRTGRDLAAGVTFRALTGAATTQAYYLSGATRGSVDLGQVQTGANGSALVTIAGGSPTDAYAGTGGLPTGCAWEPHPALTVPAVVFLQQYRPTNAPNMTCSL